MFNCFSGPVTNVINCLLPPGVKNNKYIPRNIAGDFKRVISHRAEGDLIPTRINDQTLSLVSIRLGFQWIIVFQK